MFKGHRSTRMERDVDSHRGRKPACFRKGSGPAAASQIGQSVTSKHFLAMLDLDGVKRPDVGAELVHAMRPCGHRKYEPETFGPSGGQ